MFKKGDKVTCVDIEGRDHLTAGKNYTVQDDYRPPYVRILDDRGYDAEYYPSRFTLHTPKQTDMIPEGLEPFDLETALANPDRVCTRDGRSIEQIIYLDKLASGWKIVAVISGSMYQYNLLGVSLSDTSKTEVNSLFLRAVEVKRFLVVGIDSHSSTQYKSLEYTIAATREDFNGAAIEFTYRANQLVDVRIAHRFNEQP